MIIKHPTDQLLFATFNIEGTGIGVWAKIWPEDIDSHEEPERIPGLAIWAANDRFFVVKLDEGEDPSVLAEEVWKNRNLDPETKLVQEFEERDLPGRGEATGLFGNCKFRGQSQVRIL